MEYIVSKPKTGKIKEIVYQFINIIGDMYPIADQEIKKYIERIFQDMSNDELIECMEKRYSYKDKIKQKIKTLASEYAEEEFLKQIDIGSIIVKPEFELKKAITPGKLGADIMKSLYEREASMNNFESKRKLRPYIFSSLI